MARRVDVIRIDCGTSRGTGFLIDEERVLTALHVSEVPMNTLFFPTRPRFD